MAVNFNVPLILVSIIILVDCSSIASNNTELSIVHMNDFHARYDETNFDGGLCKGTNCIGGFARLYACIKTLLEENPNSIFLNGGDNFEGTLWHNRFKWNVTQHFFNKLAIDAYTLGNHEFDEKIEGLVSLLQHLKAPVVVSNIDATREPRLHNLIKKSVVIERQGLKIGIIGVILSTIKELVDIGNLTLLDESESVNAEAQRLVEDENVFTNIILSHCGYDVEKVIARKATAKISVIVGGHSHTLLHSADSVSGTELPMGPYPTEVENADGQKVLVVQASSYNKYVGNLTVHYDKNGNVVKWAGSPIFLNSSWPKDEEINKEILLWKKEMDGEGDEIVGSTMVRLEQSSCALAECLIGNFITDAMVFAYIDSIDSNSWTRSSIALTHAGGLRSGIDIGNITLNEIISVHPFKNTFDLAEIKGEHLKNILEFSVNDENINLLQVSGIKVTFNLTLPNGSKITSLKLRCRECVVPKYEELRKDKFYRIVLPSFLVGGGFGFHMFKNYLQNIQIGELDTDAIVKYVRGSPIFQEIGGRIIIMR